MEYYEVANTETRSMTTSKHMCSCKQVIKQTKNMAECMLWNSDGCAVSMAVIVVVSDYQDFLFLL